MYTIDDIQIFITTYNRSAYLKEAIESILNQSAKVKEIIVLDNDSPDDTENVVNSYSNKGVKYVKTTGFLGNYYKAKEMANKQYCLVFHDDDILHPDYLKIALKLLNKYPNVALLTTRYTKFNNNDSPKKFNKIIPNYYLFNSQQEFVTNLFFVEKVAYAPAIYKTEAYKNEDLEYERFSKYNDWPLMSKVAKYGKTILIDNMDIFYCRVHQYQDSFTTTNALSVQTLVNWDYFFYNILKDAQDKNIIKYYKYKSPYYQEKLYNSIVMPLQIEKYSYEQFLEYAKQQNYECYLENNENQITKKMFGDFYDKISWKHFHCPLINFLGIFYMRFMAKYFPQKKDKKYWVRYLSKNKEQEYINHLAVKLKDKKLLLYGYGMICQLIMANYDLSELNIVAISDKKFEDSNDTEINGIKTVTPDKLSTVDFDIVLSSLYTNVPIYYCLNYQNLTQNIVSIFPKEEN